MQCGRHANVTDRARLQLVGPAPADVAEAEMAAREKQNAWFSFFANTTPSVTGGAAAVSVVFVVFDAVAAAAAWLNVLLDHRRCAGGDTFLGAYVLQDLFEIGA